MEKRVCNICKKKLVSIGNSRKNGKDHGDWSTRRMHKKCWKDFERIQQFLSTVREEGSPFLAHI